MAKLVILYDLHGYTTRELVALTEHMREDAKKNLGDDGYYEETGSDGEKRSIKLERVVCEP